MADIINLQPHLIGTPANGVNLYQVPNASMEVLEDIINATWNLALSKSDAVGLKTAAITAASGMLDPTLAPTATAGSVAVPSIVAPPVTIPAGINVPAIFADFKLEYLDLATWLTNQYTAWITTYAPNNQSLYTAGESSLLAALQSDTFVPAAVQNQIMGDAAARVLSDADRASDAVVAQFAARGFPLPPDAALSAVLQIQQKAQDEMAETSRKIVVMSVEQYRFVVEKTISSRDMVLKYAVEYAKVEAMSPEIISKMMGIGYDIQTKLINAAAAFYNADSQAKEVIAKVGEFNANIAFDASKANQASTLTIIEDNLKALLGEIASVTQQATAALNNLHTQVSMNAGGTTVTTQAESL